MPQNNTPIKQEPDSIEWDEHDEIYIARGYIPGYGNFTCHGYYEEQCLEEFKNFAESIRQEIVDYGFVAESHQEYWGYPEMDEDLARPTPPDDHFGFGDFLDVEYF